MYVPGTILYLFFYCVDEDDEELYEGEDDEDVEEVLEGEEGRLMFWG